MKTCTQCGLSKDESEFGVHRCRPDGRRGKCKVCNRVYAAAMKSRPGETEKSQEYMKNYYSENAEKMKERTRTWALDNPERKKAMDAAYVAQNPERIAENLRNWRASNKDRRNATARAWYAADVEKHRAEKAAEVKRNSQRHAAYQAKRRAGKLRATPVWANQFYISEAYHLAKLRTEMTGFEWHVDHLVPLKSKYVCGLHVEYNLSVIPGSENIAKGNRYWPDRP